MPVDVLSSALAAEEDKLLTCVHCGFCLPACPTYRRLGDENDSPRGRLYLMRAVVDGRLPPDDDAVTTHLDRCLGCRACEPVCPSGVGYGFLLERARDLVAREAGSSFMARSALRVFGSRTLTRLVSAFGRVLRSGGVARGLARVLPRGLGRTRFALAMVGATAPARPFPDGGTGSGGDGGSAAPSRPYPDGGTGRERDGGSAAPSRPYAAGETGSGGDGGSAAPSRPYADGGTGSGGDGGRAASDTGGGEGSVVGRRPMRVAMLTGCVQEGLFRRVNEATRAVLEANGCEIVKVPGQVCCGALHAHNGELDGARSLARRNVRAFRDAGVEYVVVNAAGCGAMMKDYGELLAGGPLAADARNVSASVRDLFELLAELGPVQGGRVPLRVTYDAPCHLHHGQGITEAPLNVLRTIPGLELVPLPDADECCGGAGIYGMTHPELGGRILGDKLAAIRSTGATVVVTPNPGCMMQIGAGLALAGDDRVVMHPVELLAESYRRSAS
ncbi:MAG: heterodisulfide reductase-related iron-sulfur binding cluster [Gemmatimonadota bacterium]